MIDAKVLSHYELRLIYALLTDCVRILMKIILLYSSSNVFFYVRMVQVLLQAKDCNYTSISFCSLTLNLKL